MTTTPPIPYSVEDDLAYLRQLNNELPHAFRQINHRLLYQCSDFLRWVGSTSHHHCDEGGLLRHTAQVIRTCKFFHSFGNERLNWPFLFTAALWHDFGKLWDYEQEPEGEFKKTRHREIIRHPARSYAEFMAEVQKFHFDLNYADEIGHLILSHHGRREWDAAVEPMTAEAWALHLADMASSKLYEERKHL